MCQVLQLGIFYSQLAILDVSVAPEGNNWHQRHVDQGFSWRRGSVSFGTLRDVGELRVKVQSADDIDIGDDAIRAIVVPFSVSSRGHVIITDIVNDHTLEMPEGKYALVFEIGYAGEDSEWCRLTFVPTQDVTPQILRADAGITPSDPLLMEADPAWEPPKL